MAKDTAKIREISIVRTKKSFSLFRRSASSKKEYEFGDLASLRQLLSNEKARVLDVIKTENPVSIYDLAKKLGRNFKSVDDDINILKKFGFIELKEEQTKARKRYRPIVVVDRLDIRFQV